MSKEREIVQTVRAVIEALGFDVVGNPVPVNKARDKTVMMWPDTVERKSAGDEKQRWTLALIFIVVSKLESETDERLAFERPLDDVREVVKGLDDAEPLKPGSALGIESIRRGRIQYFIWPGADAGRPAGAIFNLTMDWVE